MNEDSPSNKVSRQISETPYLDIDEAADRLKLSRHTLNKWRCEGRGPVFRDHGRRIVYHVDDLDRWSQDHKRQKARGYGVKNPISSDDNGGEK
ncbi:MAG: helix-turn-helix domain-containing protein [Rhizobiaceae bacterium]|nr:helix-turn-helix domain-containing protein [Rhizobiaceae bacterium]